ncbi:TrmH family RNA methyltransferase [Mucisphaera calidilacus]|uniref:23S rRNA (Uridine(2479)-2'-O)-methyltransferase n=1 Tax=Mucisphaera calidilacus TaxID=2527982 RepID=A0A518C019_9BACT|nr:RNA methyltransferase [Mucisphaera calidilacus]QDU72568.1 23S rRNA (uridine(2479)-2'-O)-methyltransferase [Mucisphaera calidilacus]
MRSITSPANPSIKRISQLRKPARQRRENLLLAEGTREITRALAASLNPETLLVADDLPPDAIPAIPDDRIITLPRPLLAKLTYHDEPEGLLATFERPHWPESTLKNARRILVAVATAKPGNLGAMARTAAALGYDAILAAGDTVDPFNPNAIRTSTGAVFALPILTMDVPAALDFLRNTATSRQTVAAEVQAATDYRAIAYTTPLTLIIGPEDTGLTPPWLAAVDDAQGIRALIPMNPLPGTSVDSLNAATAAALIMAESTRT